MSSRSLAHRSTRFQTLTNPPPSLAQVLKLLFDDAKRYGFRYTNKNAIRAVVVRCRYYNDAARGPADDVVRFLINVGIVIEDPSGFYVDVDRGPEVLDAARQGREASPALPDATRIATITAKTAAARDAKHCGVLHLVPSPDSATAEVVSEVSTEAQSVPAVDSGDDSPESPTFLVEQHTETSDNDIAGAPVVAEVDVQVEKAHAMSLLDLDAEGLREYSDTELNDHEAAVKAIGDRVATALRAIADDRERRKREEAAEQLLREDAALAEEEQVAAAKLNALRERRRSLAEQLGQL